MSLRPGWRSRNRRTTASSAATSGPLPEDDVAAGAPTSGAVVGLAAAALVVVVLAAELVMLPGVPADELVEGPAGRYDGGPTVVMLGEVGVESLLGGHQVTARDRAPARIAVAQ